MAEKRGEQDGKMTNAQFEALKAGSTSLGKDALNNLYWYFGGHKLYVQMPNKEDSHISQTDGEEDSNWDVCCQTLKQWEGLLRKLKRSSIEEEKKLAAIVQEQAFPKAKAILETMAASTQVEEEVEALPKRRPSKKKPKQPKLPKIEGAEEEGKATSRKPKKDKAIQRKKSDAEEESGSLDEELTSPLDVGKRGGMKKKPPEKEKSNGRGGGVLVKKNKPSISSDDSEAMKPTKADDDETFETEDHPLETTENPKTEGTRSSGRRAARNCMMRQRQVLRLTEDPSSEEEEIGRNRKRSRRDSDDDFSDEQGRKKKKSGAKRRPSTDKPPASSYPVKLAQRPQAEERKVFMFTTNLANAAADAVEKHLVQSIIVYHCQHPSPTGYLCSSIPNVSQFARRPGVMESHPGQLMADPRMSGYSRGAVAPPSWDMHQMFTTKPVAVHPAVSTWQPPPFNVTDHVNNPSRERLHNPSPQVAYHAMHHPPNPFSQNPTGYPQGGYRPLSHPPPHPMYTFQGPVPPGVAPQQPPGGPSGQPSFPDYSVEDLTQILVGGAAGGPGAAHPRPSAYGPSELYRAQGYEHGQVGRQSEQGTTYGMQSGPYPYQNPSAGYPPRGPDVSGHMTREYFSSHPGMPRGQDMAMYQGVVRDSASTDYYQHWGMHPRPSTQPQQMQQETLQRQTDMYNDHLRQPHTSYVRMSSPSVHSSAWPPPPPYGTPQQSHEADTSGTPHDTMYQGRPQSSSNAPPRGTPTTPNTPHDVHHMWQPSRGAGGSVASDPLSHQMPTQQSDQHQETGRASARSSLSGYSQADATGASTLLEMSSGVGKLGPSQHSQSMGAFASYPPGADRNAGHMMTGPDSKYLHMSSSQPGMPMNSDPLSVLASLTDKQSPLPQAGLMHSEKGDDRHDMKGSSEGESNGSVGSSKRATSFSIENLTAPHRKDVPGMDTTLNTTFAMSMTPSNAHSGPMSGSPFPSANSIPHQGYPSGWGASNPGFQHPGQKTFHPSAPYGTINDKNHGTSEGGPQQQASRADSQGDPSQQDS